MEHTGRHQMTKLKLNTYLPSDYYMKLEKQDCKIIVKYYMKATLL